jgi:putative adenylate-forming enzyme
MNKMRLLAKVPFFMRVRLEHGLNTTQKIRLWQDAHMLKHLQWVLKHSSYYQNLYQGLNIHQWRSFPVTEKKAWMQCFDHVNTCGLSKEKAMQQALQQETSRDFRLKDTGVSVGLSSGTSGSRGLFLASVQEQAHYAAAVLARVLPKPLWQTHRVAFFLRANNRLYQSTQSHVLAFEYFDLTLPLSLHLEKLQTLKATMLVAPPSVLRHVAQWVSQGLLKHTFKKIVSVAEVLDPLDARFLENTFQQTIHQVYQCTEGFLAATCEKGTLHVNEDLLVVQKEYLDEASGRFVPVISDFFRTSQPVIRYRLNDVLIEKKEACACGSARMALQHIEGRCDDVLQLVEKHSQQKIPIFPDFIRRAVVLASDAVEGYRVEQTDYNVLRVGLDVPPALKEVVFEQVKNNIRAFVQTQGACDVDIQHVDYHTPYGPAKMRRVLKTVL